MKISLYAVTSRWQEDSRSSTPVDLVMREVLFRIIYDARNIIPDDPRTNIVSVIASFLWSRHLFPFEDYHVMCCNGLTVTFYSSLLSAAKLLFFTVSCRLEAHMGLSNGCWSGHRLTHFRGRENWVRISCHGVVPLLLHSDCFRPCRLWGQGCSGRLWGWRAVGNCWQSPTPRTIRCYVSRRGSESGEQSRVTCVANVQCARNLITGIEETMACSGGSSPVK